MHAPQSSLPPRRALSPALVAELKAQHQRLPRSAQRDTYLAQLSHPELGVVVTGQQVGLFLGPAYSLYKAATTVVLARRLAQRSGLPTVPMFWLQSEDHDAAEVCTAKVLTEDAELAAVTLNASGDERAAMAERALGDGVIAALDSLKQQLQQAPHHEEALALLERAYQPNRSWADAYAHALAELFADQGLLIVNPRTAAMAALARPIHQRAFEDDEQLAAAVQQGAEALARQDKPVLIQPRADCSLSFYHPSGASGPRYRLRRVADGFAIPPEHTLVSRATLLDQLAQTPLRFSTSALLRVILQDTLLPTQAQIAGPGEARYLQQMPPLRAAFGLTETPLVERARFVVSDPGCRRRLQALELNACAIDDEEPLLRAMAQQDAGLSGEDVAAQLHSALEPTLVALRPELGAIEPALEKALARTQQHILRGVSKLAQRVEAARARKNEVRVERVRYLTQRMRPGGAPQERVLAFPHFAARYGIAPLKEALFEAIEQHLDNVEQGTSRLLELSL